ncbi:hypothetical protein [Janthinobacterium sp. Ant5-2-1]|uniref:hypothetical protein n=1 Tax=Janthinobacterium sp. Ant5-2-1 TaxID=1755239 RepID=UPI000718021B|nr:hypothetical protein [Janthinobacterium sp. Ant5-2-1]
MTMLIMSANQARSYRTARFNSRARAMQSCLPTVPVRIVFMNEQYNAFHQRNECVFASYADADDKSLIGTYFQHALMNFSKLSISSQ